MLPKNTRRKRVQAKSGCLGRLVSPRSAHTTCVTDDDDTTISYKHRLTAMLLTPCLAMRA